MLIVYPRTNKQNQKKKRKVEPPTPQVTQGHTHTAASPLPPSQGHGLALVLGSIPPSHWDHQPTDAACVEGESWGKPVRINSWSSLQGHTLLLSRLLWGHVLPPVCCFVVPPLHTILGVATKPIGNQGEVLFMGHFVRNRMKFHRAPVTPFEMTPEIMGMKGKY